MKFDEAFATQINFVSPETGISLQPHTASTIEMLHSKRSHFGTEWQPGDYMLFALIKKEEPTPKGMPEIELMVTTVNSRDKEMIEREYDIRMVSTMFPTLTKK